MEWSEGGKWDNCNSIINKYIFLKKKVKRVGTGVFHHQDKMSVWLVSSATKPTSNVLPHSTTFDIGNLHGVK